MPKKILVEAMEVVGGTKGVVVVVVVVVIVVVDSSVLLLFALHDDRMQASKVRVKKKGFVVLFINVVFYLEKSIDLSASKNFFSVSSSERELFPPAAFRCPPPSK